MNNINDHNNNTFNNNTHYNNTFNNNTHNNNTFNNNTHNNRTIDGGLNHLYDEVDALLNDLENLENPSLVYNLSRNPNPQNMFVLCQFIFNAIPQYKIELNTNINRSNMNNLVDKNVMEINRHLDNLGVKNNGHSIKLTTTSVSLLTVACNMRWWLSVLKQVLKEVVIPFRRLQTEHQTQVGRKSESSSFLAQDNISSVPLWLMQPDDQQFFKLFLQTETEQPDSFEAVFTQRFQIEVINIHQHNDLDRQLDTLSEELHQLKVRLFEAFALIKTDRFLFYYQIKIGKKEAKVNKLLDVEKQLKHQIDCGMEMKAQLKDAIFIKLVNEQTLKPLKKSLKNYIAELETVKDSDSNRRNKTKYNKEIHRLHALLSSLKAVQSEEDIRAVLPQIKDVFPSFEFQ